MTEIETANQMYNREYQALPDFYSKTEKRSIALSETYKKCKAMIDACKSDKENENYKFYCKVYIILSTFHNKFYENKTEL